MREEYNFTGAYGLLFSLSKPLLQSKLYVGCYVKSYTPVDGGPSERSLGKRVK